MPEQFGIMLQGGYASEYTLATCRSYRARWSDVPIVVSTWREDEAAWGPDAAVLKQLDVRLVLSERPAEPGPQNTNLQLVSARAGLRALCGLGVTHALKSRTDVRLQGDARALLEHVRQEWPLADGTSGQAERIVISQTYTRRGMPYHVSDMVVMGAATDLLAYFDAPLRQGEDQVSKRWNTISPLHDRIFSEQGVTAHVEQYLCVAHLRRLGWVPRWTIADWYRVLATLFCVLDDGTLGFHWQKNPGTLGGARRYDSDFMVTRAPFRVHSSLICRRVRHDDWRRMVEGTRPRIDAGSPAWLLALTNAAMMIRDLPAWGYGFTRRRFRRLTGRER